MAAPGSTFEKSWTVKFNVVENGVGDSVRAQVAKALMEEDPKTIGQWMDTILQACGAAIKAGAHISVIANVEDQRYVVQVTCHHH